MQVTLHAELENIGALQQSDQLSGPSFSHE
jgi:hypothetical protein